MLGVFLLRRHLELLSAIFGLIVFGLAATEASAEQTVRIGVLTYRGPAVALSRWSPTAAYLTATVDGYRFEIVPLTVDSIEAAVDGTALSFLLTSPGSYVDLASRYGITRVLTLKSRAGSGADIAANRIGAVIFTLAARDDMQSLSDLKGKSLAAIAPDSFDDFQIAWGEMSRQGIDPFRDLSAVKFVGLPKDAAVRAVEAGRTDAGVARSGLLEMMAAEGHVDLSRFRILNPRIEAGFPYRLSTRLYPEWAFATLPQTPMELSEQVVSTLLRMDAGESAAVQGMYAGWTVPVSDKPVHDLMRDLAIGPYSGRLVRWDEYQSWSLAGLALLVALALAGTFASWLRRRPPQKPAAASVSPDTTKLATTGKPDQDELAATQARLSTLTEREREVLELMVQGDANKEIARALEISPRTVEFHRANVMQKMAAGSIAELIRATVINQFFQPDNRSSA